MGRGAPEPTREERAGSGRLQRGAVCRRTGRRALLPSTALLSLPCAALLSPPSHPSTYPPTHPPDHAPPGPVSHQPVRQLRRSDLEAELAAEQRELERVRERLCAPPAPPRPGGGGGKEGSRATLRS